MFWRWKKGEELHYADVFKKLSEKDIRYVLIGGVAINLWGIERTTGDIDVALAMDSNNIIKFVKAMKALGLVPKVPVNPEELADPAKRKEWQEEKNMLVFSFQHPDNPFILIDVMINNPLDFDKMWSNRVILENEGVKLSVASVDDLINLKEKAGRDKDLLDVAALKRFVKKQ